MIINKEEVENIHEKQTSETTINFRRWIFESTSITASSARNAINPTNEMTPTATPKLQASTL